MYYFQVLVMSRLRRLPARGSILPFLYPIFFRNGSVDGSETEDEQYSTCANSEQSNIVENNVSDVDDNADKHDVANSDLCKPLSDDNCKISFADNDLQATERFSRGVKRTHSSHWRQSPKNKAMELRNVHDHEDSEKLASTQKKNATHAAQRTTA